ncbi:MAG: flagellar basal body P-ring protein FlgI [Thiotrichales bacterium]|jgi:flagellar P-ring protein precursor FlgI|nr:flagellar basal body P-ring protein FlgI [Pseudomonadota bacterium]MCI4410755.1 flagellar basal body P-ring protein FlgI [Thiotrichales bacterium]
MKRIVIASLIAIFGIQPVLAERIKDLAQVQGVRNNQLIGYGLVVGLNGTGDKNPFTDQSLNSMLTKFGINMPPGVKPNSKNIAAVAVHADLPPFIKPGQTIDVSVASLGNAKSLAGGSLLMTPLRGLDGNVYAMAQGALVVGGLDASGKDGSKITINYPGGGHVPNGAIVERGVDSGFDVGNTLTLNLRQGDFTTAKTIVDAINQKFGADTARALDAQSIEVMAPRMASQKVSYLSEIENIEVTPAQSAAKVIVNARTGTVVIGQNVRIGAAAVAHGNLSVSVGEGNNVSQPNPFANGQTAVTPASQVAVDQQKARMFKFESGVSLDELVKTVNKIGASPSDLVAILEALKASGALKAELLVI